MIPTSIDGTDITGATIDGQDVQEITVDGQTVFSAAPAIPDSVVWQTPYDEGSGVTVADIIGSADGTINGATWKSSGLNVGGQYLEFDGNDNVDYGTPSVLDLPPGGEWTIEIAARINPGDSGTLLSKGGGSGPSRQWQLFVADYYFSRVGGAITSSNIEPSGNWEVVHLRNDFGSVEIFIDGSSVGSGSAGTATESGQTVYAGARTDGSSFNLTGDLDSPVIHDIALSNSSISDRANAYPNW